MRDNKSNVGRAMPPVTPRSVSKDIALSECFDYIWLQVILLILLYYYKT